MKSIVVGFSDTRGATEPKIVCGPEVSDAKQYKVLSDAKQHQKYPKGIKRLEHLFLEPRNIAIETTPSET